MTFKESLTKFASALEGIKKQGLNPLQENKSVKQIYDFKTKKDNYQISFYKTSFEELKRNVLDLNDLRKVDEKNEKIILNINILLKDVETAVNTNNLNQIGKKLEDIKFNYSTLILPQKTVDTITAPTTTPADIKSEIKADIDELNKCFTSECYRSAMILCGRIMETVLHRKYYEITENDSLEKSPGIGLGSIISKLKEKEIELPPGLPNQIHLINQVRISSVHKQQQAFYPTKTQTEAVMLLTIDVLEQLFSK